MNSRQDLIKGIASLNSDITALKAQRDKLAIALAKESCPFVVGDILLNKSTGRYGEVVNIFPRYKHDDRYGVILSEKLHDGDKIRKCKDLSVWEKVGD
jgi:hypothetical protein